MRRPGLLPCAGGLALAFLVSSCTREYYRNSADEEVYEVLQQKEEEGGETLALGAFQVEQQPIALDSVGRIGETEDFSTAPPPEPPELEETLAPEGEAPLREGEDPAREGEAPAEPPQAEEIEAQAEALAEQAEAPAREGEAPAEPESPDSEPPAEAEAPAREGDALSEPRAPNSEPPAEAEAPTEPLAPGDDISPQQVSVTIPGVEMVDARILDIEESLKLALANNREYQSNREGVYLSALALTLARWDFAPRFFGVITGDYRRSSDGERSGSVDSNFGMNLLLANGARLSINILNNFFQYFTGNRREVARTIIQGAITQPLLRGFGKEIVQEPLIQAERNLVYQIRSFRRFRQTFAVRVVAAYYRVLQQRDRVANEYDNWKSLVQNRDRAEWNARAGRLAQLEVDQARQQEFQAQDRYISAVQLYETVLDEFKILLGISIGEAIAPDPQELVDLVENGVQAIDIEVESAIDAAFEMRLDLATSRDQVDDSIREIEVVADALRMQLDLSADVSVPSGEGGEQKPLRFNADNIQYGFGFSVDLPLDRKRERNAYVSAIIAHEREKRDHSLFEDNIRLTVRDAYRTLQREFVSYAIQKRSVELAKRRVASTLELRDAGRASTRDVLESQSALIDAQNALTGSLITYSIARLELFRDMGILDCDEDGNLYQLAYGAMIP